MCSSTVARTPRRRRREIDLGRLVDVAADVLALGPDGDLALGQGSENSSRVTVMARSLNLEPADEELRAAPDQRRRAGDADREVHPARELEHGLELHLDPRLGLRRAEGLEVERLCSASPPVVIGQALPQVPIVEPVSHEPSALRLIQSVDRQWSEPWVTVALLVTGPTGSRCP